MSALAIALFAGVFTGVFTGVAAAGEPGEWSVGLAPAAQLHTGPEAVAVGVGPAASARLRLHPRASVYATVGAMLYGPPLVQVNVGGMAHLRPESFWSPAVGLEFASTWGGILRVQASTEAWRSAYAPLLAPRVVLRPLSFHSDEPSAQAWTVSALTVSAGVGLEAPGSTLSLGVELLTLERGFW